MISSVSFRSSVPFAEMIKQPQKYSTPAETPTASSPINGEKKGSTGKKVVGTLVGLAALAAGVVVLGKKAGSLDISKLKDGKIKNFLSGEKVQNFLNGDKFKKFANGCDGIYTFVTKKAQTLWSNVTEFFGKIGKKAPVEE